MNETTENFWQAIRAWNPPPPQPVLFRLYHDAAGNPICYSHQDLPGEYIDVEPIDFALASMAVRVVDGKLYKVTPATMLTKLIPSHEGTSCNPYDVAVVVPQDQSHCFWSASTRTIGTDV